MSCRNSARRPKCDCHLHHQQVCDICQYGRSISWTELVDSDIDQDEVTIAVLKAAKELIEDQEREIAELKSQLARK
jgi:hypothetical protein